MKALVLLIILIGFVMGCMSGCASVSYETPDGTKVTYTRFLTTSDSIRASVGNAKVEANSQKIDAETLKFLLGVLAK